MFPDNKLIPENQSLLGHVEGICLEIEFRRSLGHAVSWLRDVLASVVSSAVVLYPVVQTALSQPQRMIEFSSGSSCGCWRIIAAYAFNRITLGVTRPQDKVRY